LNLADELAQTGGSPRVIPEHLLWALVQLPDGSAVRTLEQLGIESGRVQKWAAEMVEVAGPAAETPVVRDPSIQKIIALAYIVARERGFDTIGTGHLLIGLARCERFPVSTRLAREGATLPALERALTLVESLKDPGPSSVNAGLAALAERRGVLDFLAFMALTEVIGALNEPARTSATQLRAELHHAILTKPLTLAARFALGEVVAAAFIQAAQRRETMSAAHLVLAISRIEGTRLKEILASPDWSGADWAATLTDRS